MFLTIQKNNHFVANETSLWNFYAPLIGIEAAGLYMWLCHKSNSQINPCQFTDKELASCLKIDSSKLMQQLSVLVNVNLIRLYEHLNQPQHFLVEIYRPLNQIEILNNHNLTTKLQTTLGYSEFAILMEQNKIPFVDNAFVEVSDQYKTEINESNINKLVNEIFAQYNLSLNLDQRTHQLLKQAFILFNDNFEFIYKIVCDSVVIQDSNDYINLDCALFEHLLNQQLSNFNSSKLLVNIKRNKEIFELSTNIEDFSEILADYEKYNPNKYYTLIMKRNLTSEELEAIQPLLKCMPNSFANMILDYVLIKNNGRLVKEYITKIRDSVLVNNFDHLSDLLQYLKNAYHNTGFKVKKAINKKVTTTQELASSTINYKDLFDY